MVSDRSNLEVVLSLSRTSDHTCDVIVCQWWRAGRAVLDSRELVVCLRGHRVVDDSPWALAALELGSSENDNSNSATVCGDEAIFWHIGAHSYSPFCSTFKPLTLKCEFVEEGVRKLVLQADASIKKL